MNEYTIVTVIAALVGLFLSIGKPIINLNTAITKLQATLDSLMDQVKDLRKDNAEEHKGFNDTLDNHEKRIIKLEDMK